MLILDFFIFVIITFCILFLGSQFERKSSLPLGFGPIILFLGAQQVFSILTINPWGSKSIWIIESISIWGFLAIFSFWKLINGRLLTVEAFRFGLFSAIGALIFLFLQPGERTWDGAGYHNVISLLIFQKGELWNWPNLMWAQWFPAGQETLAASFLVLFNGYNGLIVPTIIWLVLFLNLVNVNLPFQLENKLKLVVSLFLVAVTPIVLVQTGTSYVDIQTGITFMILCYLLTKSRSGLLGKISLAIASAGLVSSKWSGIPFLGILILFCFTYRNFSMKKRFEDMYILGIGASFGIFPVAIRNLFEFGSPTYPFKGPLNLWPGLFPQSLMTNQIGVANQPAILRDLNTIEVFFYEYIYSIFLFLKLILVNFLNNGFYFNRFNPDSLNYISYDARLGGFGLVLTSLLIIAFYINKSNWVVLLRYLVLLIPIFLFPMNWWARYFIGIPMAILFIEQKSLLNFFHAGKFRRYVGIATLSVFAVVNIFSFLAFSHFQKTSWPSVNGYAGKISSLVSEECSDVLVVGEGLTFSSALWGDDKCNRVIGSIHFGNNQESLGQYGSIPIINQGAILDEVHLSLRNYPSLILVLTYPDQDKPRWAIDLLESISKSNKIKYVLYTTESNGHPVILIQTKANA